MGIDTDKASDSLFGNIKKMVPMHPVEETPIKTTESIDTPAREPKWKTLEKVTVLLSEDQKDGLDRVAKNIMKHRKKTDSGSSEKERVTTNTLIRVLVDNFLEHEKSLTPEVINNEEQAKKWVEKLFKIKK